ncbi:MAG: hypothetical protein ACLQBA_25050, partial [Candidatus Binataceae bacterium]
GFLSILALGILVHGGLLLLPNPIFRSGEECRHSNLNNLQDIALLLPYCLISFVVSTLGKGCAKNRGLLPRTQSFVDSWRGCLIATAVSLILRPSATRTALLN